MKIYNTGYKAFFTIFLREIFFFLQNAAFFLINLFENDHVFL